MATPAQVGEVVIHTCAVGAVTPARGAVIHAVLTAGPQPSRGARAAVGSVGAVGQAGRAVAAGVGAARVPPVFLYLHREARAGVKHEMSGYEAVVLLMEVLRFCETHQGLM